MTGVGEERIAVVHEVRLLGDPVLRERSSEVTRFDEELARFLDDLVETMYAADGVGLAATQVGDLRRATVIDVGDRRDGSEVLELVNPRIVGTDGLIESEEGCLSIPGIVATVPRAAEVEVAYRDRRGDEHRVVGSELLSRALQHEIDHLEGILFIDHLGPLRRDMILREWRRAGEEAGSAPERS